MPAQRKKPFRPREAAEVTQCYNDGTVTVYDVRSDAVKGYMPTPSYQVKAKLPYQERKLGIRRYYDARQNQVRVERVIRVPKPSGVFQPEDDAPEPLRITSQDAARTEDGQLYRIDLVQSVPEAYPPSLDLTLAVYEQYPVTAPELPAEDEPEDEGGGR